MTGTAGGDQQRIGNKKEQHEYQGGGESWGMGRGRSGKGVQDARVQHKELVIGLESQISLGGCAQAADEVLDQLQE